MTTYTLQPVKEKEHLSQVSFSPAQKHSLDVALSNLFPEKSQETRVQKARRIMGDGVKNMSDAELDACLAEFQYLIDCWLDEFERKLFNNLTLRQLLMEV